ncbi:MAG TPA: type II toxin-antitoxin system RelE/ParE family toxin [Gammaproteobacteria bacterium]|nr:type II toxin-antitoxin system RelE/ParE family toxin [Gammaproteobacteria bacterium]
MYHIRLHKQAAKGLLKMPRKMAKKLQMELARIAQSPKNYTGDFKPLRGRPAWRLRIGGWRAICEIHDDELVILVLDIAPRGDIYK